MNPASIDLGAFDRATVYATTPEQQRAASLALASAWARTGLALEELRTALEVAGLVEREPVERVGRDEWGRARSEKTR